MASMSLEAAIQGLIGGDAQAIRQANSFLLSFVDTEAAWSSSLELFQSPNEHVRFFASNILYTKVKRHWTQLNSAQQDEIYRFLINVVENFGQYNSATTNLKGSNEYQAFLGRVILSLCCVCSFATDGLAIFIDIAFRKINSLLLANPSEADVVSSMVGLEMMHLLPTEVDAMDIGASTRGELESQLVKCSPIFMEKVDQISSALVANFSSQYSRDIHIGIIKAIRSWLLQGLTLTNLYEDHEVALRLVCASLQSDDPERVKMGSSFLRELVCVGDFPRSRKRDEAVILLMHSFVESAAQLAPFFDLNSDRGDHDVGYEICYCMVSIASQEIELSTSQQYCNVEFFRLLLSCATLKPRKIASLTFDLWLSLQDTPVSERHPYTHQEIFETLLDILMKQSMYPPNFMSWEDDTDDDEDDFKDFRDKRHGIQDVLLICCHALREKFFDIVASFLFKVNPGDASPLEGFKKDGRWQEMESALFVLHNCMDAVKGMVKSESSKAPSLQFLASTLHLIFSLPENIMRKQEVQATVCQTLGCLTFLIANQNATKGKVSGASSFSSNSQAAPSSFPLPASVNHSGIDGTAENNVDYTTFFLPALNVLFQCLSSASSSTYAAKSILQLCVHGQKILLATSQASGVREAAGSVGCNQLVDALISVTTEKIADDTLASPLEDPLSGTGGGESTAAAAHPMLTVIEAVVRTLVALPVSHIAEALTRLGRPIVDCLHQEISVGLNFERVTLLMHYAGQLIRFSDAVEDESALIEFLTLLWGQLRVLESHTRWNNSPMVLNSLFDIYGRAIMSAKNLVIPEVPRITQTVVTVFQMRISSSAHSMQCASVIVEALCNQSPEKDVFLVNLLEHCTRVLVGHAGSSYEAFIKDGAPIMLPAQDPAETGIFGYDPECIEKFFRFLYSYFIMCPNIIAQSPEALSHLPRLATFCSLKVKENGPVRLILTVLQSFWSGGGTNRKIDEGSQRALLSASLPSGKQLVSHLIDIIGGSVGVSSILWPNAIDTLYAVISGCDRAEQAMLAREWIGAKMAEDSVFVGRIPTERKQFVYETMFRLAASDRRRFKQLLQDVCKICSCEVDSEVLSIYQT